MPQILGSPDSYYQQLKKHNFHKPHHLNFAKDEPVVDKANDGSNENSGPTESGGKLITSEQKGLPVPRWVALDKVILRYYSYVFEGPIENRTDEKMRIRYFEIHLFMEDETIMIIEHEDAKAERRVGKFMNRQMVIGDRYKNGHLSISDLVVGQHVEIFGRQHFIFRVDNFTRTSLKKMGLEVPDDQTPPMNQHNMERAAAHKLSQRMRRHISQNHDFARFLKYDTNVLRFYAYWDDRESLFGERHFLVIHHYLGDQTTEVVRKIETAYGKEKLDPFIRRCRLAKNPADYAKVDNGSPWPVLNIIPQISKYRNPTRLIFDQAQFDQAAEIYQDSDFQTGSTINIMARPVFIYDCDDFTRWYYQETFGYDQKKFDVEEPVKEKPPSNVPAYNGYGTEEDSLGNCVALVPKPPRLDVRKYLLLDSDQEDPDKLIFELRMVSDVPANNGRRFVMSFGMNEDKVLLFEKHVPPGMIPGRFHKKTAVKVSNDPKTGKPRYLQPENLNVGALLYLNEHTFLISNVDECTGRYMEKNAPIFPFADYPLALGKLSTIMGSSNHEQLQNALANNQFAEGLVTWDTFIKSLAEIVGESLSPHELMTIARRHRSRNNVHVSAYKELFRSLIQHYFRRHHFEIKWNLRQALIKADPDATGSVPRAILVRSMKAVKAPVNYEVLDMYLDIVCGNGSVLYEEAIRDLDWLENPSKRITDIPQNVGPDFDYEKHFGLPTPLIDYEPFMKDLQRTE